VPPPNSTPARLILCYVTDRRSLQAPSPAADCGLLLEKIAAAAAAGVDWIQLREKDLPAKQCAACTREALQRVSRKSQQGRPAARILVNDRVDIALAERAAGVHLGQHSLPASEVQQLLQTHEPPADFLLGVSCHSLSAAQAAAASGASYLFFGPVFATPSKTIYGPPQGLARLAEVCRAVNIPVLAIGGVTLENAASCLHAGAAGLAAIRLYQDSADLPVVVHALRSMQ
jgi:thiamine-phosphate pyrophosphorylase